MSLLDRAKGIPEPVAVPNKPVEYIYSTPHAEQYSIQLSTGEVKAKDGVLRVGDGEHTEIQGLIKKGRPDIAQNAILLDTEAAERLAKAHIAKMNQQRRVQAQRGATSTMSSMARQQTLEGHLIPDALANMEVVEEDAVHAEDNSMDPDGKDAGEPFKE